MSRLFRLTPALLIALAGLILYRSDPDARILNAVGKLMPDDAAPSDQQIFRFLNDELHKLNERKAARTGHPIEDHARAGRAALVGIQGARPGPDVGDYAR